MQITLLCYGSQGDVEPFLALSQGLVLAGHQVRLAAPALYKPRIALPGVKFFGFPGDPSLLVRELVDQAGGSWLGMIRTMSSFVLPLAGEVAAQARKASENADLIVHSFLLTSTGFEIAREQNIPDISAQLFPVFSTTSDFPAPVFPDLPLGHLYRKISHQFVEGTFWWGSRFLYNRIRKGNQDLPQLTAWPFNHQNKWQTPILYAFSPQIIPRPQDWKENSHLTGYWFGDQGDDWHPDPGLMDFLDSGPAPIAAAFGSTRSRKLEKIIPQIEEAARICQQRLVIVGEVNSGLLPDPNVYQIDYVPYEWLFCRSSAVIHHGGAGTTGKGLMAGIPNIILPFTSDQPFWGNRVKNSEPVPGLFRPNS